MTRLLLSLAFLLSGTLAYAADFPSHTGFVTDTANILSPEQRQDIEAELKNYEAKTGTEIAILVVQDTGEMPVADYAISVANKWGVGKKSADNGALLLVAMKTHSVWITVGRQLEGALTDSQCGAIARKIINPRFREGNYHAGLKEGVMAMEKVIAGESFTTERMARGSRPTSDFRMWEIIFFFGIMVISWLAAILGRSKEIWPGAALGAVVGGGISWFLAYSLFTIGIIAAISGAAGMLFDWVVSRNYDKFRGGGPMPPWWMGGGFGGFGGGGNDSGGSDNFGGGGFSGGGGGDNW